MALSNKKILEEVKKGNIIIFPFNKQNLATSSYDVSLGEYYFREKPKSKYEDNIYNIYNKSHTDEIWGIKPIKAKRAKDVFKNFKFDFIGISQNDKVILLRPGETILAHTNEFIGGRNHITTMMKARSSLGRNFIEICKCVGWGDIGYVNRWTMEITNNSSHHTIPLVVGRRVAQIIFFETGAALETDNDYSQKGKYQSGVQLSELKKNWKPQDMLPKLYKDRDIKK